MRRDDPTAQARRFARIPVALAALSFACAGHPRNGAPTRAVPVAEPLGATTDAEGRFTLPRAAPTYSVTIASADKAMVTIYGDLHRHDPLLLFAAEPGAHRRTHTTQIRGVLSGVLHRAPRFRRQRAHRTATSSASPASEMTKV
jgi:hypothetical protein